ncbi:hypothetical protein SAMN04244575_06779, partial [Sinorhizobium meliloti]
MLMVGGSGDDMSDTVSGVALPDDRPRGFNIPCDLGDTGYISRLIGAIDPVEGAIAIRNQEPCGRSLRMPFAQIAFVPNDKFDVLGNKVDTASQLDQLRIGRASKTRIDFND